MTIWTDIGAVWRGPVLAHSGTISDYRYVVIHTADGTFEGTISWQKNPQAGNSSHFIVGTDGSIAQVNDTANRSGAQLAGNPYSISIENAGNENQPLTPAQITANAKILVKAHAVHGIPLQLTGDVKTHGLGHHSMGYESNPRVDWGHQFCPGEIIKAQKQLILDQAIQIAGGNDVSVKTDNIVAALAEGQPHGAGGEVIAPVDWRIRDEAWQASVNAALRAQADAIAALNAKISTPATIELSDAQLLAAIKAALREGVGQ